LIDSQICLFKNPNNSAQFGQVAMNGGAEWIHDIILIKLVYLSGIISYIVLTFTSYAPFFSLFLYFIYMSFTSILPQKEKTICSDYCSDWNKKRVTKKLCNSLFDYE